MALKGEFTNLDIDIKAHEVAVTTDKITLEDVLLGEFEIRLKWDCIGRVQKPYRVIARDPHPAAKNEDVTHPHVQDEHLCEGEGQTAIAAAIAEGRLYDFFLLVSQVLHTYGRGSAYVALDRWHERPLRRLRRKRIDSDDCYSAVVATPRSAENVRSLAPAATRPSVAAASMRAPSAQRILRASCLHLPGVRQAMLRRLPQGKQALPPLSRQTT